MKKALVVVLVLVVAGVIAVALWRPGSDRPVVAGKPPGFVELIGSLIPRTQVSAADLAGRPCWSEAGRLTVGPGATCVAELPDQANRLGVCIEDGVPLAVVVRGRDYPAQSADLARLACSGSPEPFDLYDTSSQLTVTCGPLAPCLLRLT